VSYFDYELRATLFHIYADQTNDAHDHDELHAAGEICEAFKHVGFSKDSYVQRWLEGLAKEHQSTS
jgi:hypothetical protein